MNEGPLKSAFELAMERLRAKDKEAGIEESAPLTERQKEEIARLRSESKAKLAELEILHRKEVATARTTGDPAKLLELEEKYRIDRGRIESRLDSAVRKVRHE